MVSTLLSQILSCYLQQPVLSCCLPLLELLLTASFPWEDVRAPWGQSETWEKYLFPLCP